MRLSKIAGVIIGVLLLAGEGRAQSTVWDDNLAVLLRMFGEISDSVRLQLPSSGRRWLVMPEVADLASADYLLRARMARSFLAQGDTVFTTSPVAQEHWRITPRLLRCELTYQQVRSGGFWRRSKWRRQALVEVEVEQLELPSGRLAREGTFHRVYADTLSAQGIRELENPRMAFTMGRWPRPSGWAQVVEPVLLTAAAAGAIYALYALRTQ